MATALGGLWLPAPAAGIETRGPYKVPDNWGIFRAAISTRGRFAGSRLPCNAAAGSAQSASQPARKAGVQSRNASPSSGRLPGIDDGPSAQGSEPLRKQQRRQQPQQQQQQQQQQQSKQQQHKAVYRTQQDSRSTETSSTTEPAITRQSRDTQSSGSRRNGSSNKSINPAARTLQASNAAGCAYSDDGSSLGGDGQRAGTSQDLRDLHEQSDTLKRRIAAARYGDGASSAEQLGADMEWQRHTCQVRGLSVGDHYQGWMIRPCRLRHRCSAHHLPILTTVVSGRCITSLSILCAIEPRRHPTFSNMFPSPSRTSQCRASAK